MDKLGFTFYPQDWWSSDSFYDFSVIERYVYLECLFIMYRNGGYMKTQKTQFENRIRLQVDDTTWGNVTSRFIKTDDGFTSLTVNKRLKKAMISKENGKLGGRPPKDKTQKTQPDNLKRKRKRKESEYTDHGEPGKVMFSIKAVYAGEKPQRVYDVKSYFTSTQQIQSLKEKGWVYFDEFLQDNPGKVFNDDDHVYNTFRNFCEQYRPPPKAPNQYEDAEDNRAQWTREAWENHYRVQLAIDNNFRKHFGYDELRSGASVGSNS